MKCSQECNRLEGVRCLACILAAGIVTAISNSEPACIAPSASAQLYCREIPADLADWPHEDHAPSRSAHLTLTVVATTTSSSTADHNSVTFRIG
jgi:hypothetical protein